MTRLPPLRSDLELVPAPSGPDGEPQLTVCDPVSGRFKRLGWAELEVLSRWGEGSVERLLASLERSSCLRLGEHELRAFALQLAAQGLLAPGATGYTAPRRPPLWSLGARWMYLRLPLIRPARLLAWLLPLGRALAHPLVIACYLACWALGLIWLATRPEQLSAQVVALWSPTGALATAVALFSTRLVHELGHALIAAAHGVRVRTMGVALIVGYPVPYTDVTEAWRLRRVAPRLWIGAGGILAELALAGVALAIWPFLPPGVGRGVCLMVGVITVVGTLLVNLNPAMRFDGYYLLSDLWRIDNLRQRSTEHARWWLRQLALGRALAPPEPQPVGRQALLVPFGIGSGVYRLLIYGALIWVAYQLLPPTFAWPLMAATVVALAMPLLLEVRRMAQLGGRLGMGWRGALLWLLLAAAVGYLVVPLPRSATLPAVMGPPAVQELVLPRSGIVRQVHVERGQRVERGQPLLSLASPAVTAELEALEAQRALTVEQLRQARTQGQGEQVPQLERQLASVRARLRLASASAGVRVLRARLSGVLVEWPTSLRRGLTLPAGYALGRIAGAGPAQVVALAGEHQRGWCREGAAARFRPIDGRPPYEVQLGAVSQTPEREAPHASLVAPHGPLAATREGGRLRLDETRYRVTATARRPPHAHWIAGQLELRTPPRSPALELLRDVLARLRREFAF